MLGFNARLDEIQAVVLRAKLPHLNNWNQKRREHARLYNELLKDTPVKTPTENPDSLPVYHLYVVSAPKRDALKAFLREQGVFTGIHYPIPIHLQKVVEFLGNKIGDFPVTEAVTPQILSLPMFAELEEDEIRYVVECIKEFYQSSN